MKVRTLLGVRRNLTFTSLATVNLAIGLFSVLAWAVQNTGVSNREVAARVPAPFKPLYDGGIEDSKVAAVWAGFPYDSIALQRTACFGPCPVYKVTLYRNGRAELHAEEWRGNTWHGKKGDFSGNVDIFDYGKLCYLLKQLRFDDLPGRFTANWTDSPTTIVTATEKRATKSVSEYSGIGPIELWAIQQAIDAIAEDIGWTAK